jgi:hypothetical protein
MNDSAVAVVQSLVVYPVKSCQGVEVESVTVDCHGRWGLDRQWAIVEAVPADTDKNGFSIAGKLVYVTQREKRSLAAIRVALEPMQLVLSASPACAAATGCGTVLLPTDQGSTAAMPPVSIEDRYQGILFGIDGGVANLGKV